MIEIYRVTVGWLQTVKHLSMVTAGRICLASCLKFSVWNTRWSCNHTAGSSLTHWLTVQRPLFTTTTSMSPTCWTQAIQLAATNVSLCAWWLRCLYCIACRWETNNWNKKKEQHMTKFETYMLTRQWCWLFAFLQYLCYPNVSQRLWLRGPRGLRGCWALRQELIIPWNRKTVVEFTWCRPLCDNKHNWFSSYRLIYVGPNDSLMSHAPTEAVSFLCLWRWSNRMFCEKPKRFFSVRSCLSNVVSYQVTCFKNLSANFLKG